ncbi:MAG: adenosylcobinamide-GDP ribazoletransferase [Desulfovibrionaceae bacterium]|nr:adenosylcobinamide-GDP ribazoletransferase [Desulfovibrionaceae bacterium]
MTTLRAALGFFTRLPVGSAPSSDVRGIMRWFPVVGLIVGTLTGLLTGLAALILPPPLSGVLGCLAWVFLTGGLHLDGVADCGDGLPVEAPPARRLEIMKDSRLGTFGGAALFFVLAVKAAALGTLTASLAPFAAGWKAFFPLAGMCCMAATLGRSLTVLAMRLPAARPDGLGARARDGMTFWDEAMALALGLAVCLVNGARGLTALAAALLAAWLILSAARKRLGGVTGDVFGCLTESVECAALTACCLM